MTEPQNHEGGNSRDYHLNMPDNTPDQGRPEGRLSRIVARRKLIGMTAALAVAVAGGVILDNTIFHSGPSRQEKAKQRAQEKAQHDRQTAQVDFAREVTLVGAIGSHTAKCAVRMDILGPGTVIYKTPYDNSPDNIAMVAPKGTELPVFEPADFSSFGSSLAGWGAYLNEVTGVIDKSHKPASAVQIAKNLMWFREPSSAAKQAAKNISYFGPTSPSAHQQNDCSFTLEGQMTENTVGSLKPTAHLMNYGENAGVFGQVNHAYYRMLQDSKVSQAN